MKITDTMVLALLKKGLLYEAQGIEMDMEMDIPGEIFGSEEDVKMKMSCKVRGFGIKIDDGDL